jgi:drug/metabolite transporter (DMT)-like permease
MAEKVEKKKNPYQRVAQDVESDAKSVESEEDKNNASTLMIAFLAMLVFALGNRIFGKLQTYPMYNYPLFMNMLSVILYVPLCFAYIIPMIWKYPNTVITTEQIQIPKYKFAVMGAYDSLAGIIQVFAVNYITNAGLIVLVQQSAIPISMIVSKLTLNSSYTMSQYVGAGIVLLGIFVVLIPQFTGHGDGADKAVDALSAAETNAQLMWYGRLPRSYISRSLYLSVLCALSFARSLHLSLVLFLSPLVPSISHTLSI